MTLFGIKKKAYCETSEEVAHYCAKVKNASKASPSGTDVRVSAVLMNAVEAFCDNAGIPCHPVTDDCLSTAGTYAALYTYEKAR